MSPALITVISNRGVTRLRQFFVDLWLYRDLFVSLLERDIKVRYKQTALGVLWVLIQPVLAAGAFTLIFGSLIKVGGIKIPYPLFYVAAMVPWVCFTSALNGAASSIEANAGLISKVYFPRVVVPLAAIIGTLPDFVIGFTLVNITAAIMGHWHWTLLAVALPLLAVQLAAAAGIGIFFTALNAQYRDVKYVVPFIVQFGLYLTPIIFPLNALSRWGQWAVVAQWFNPMAGVIATYRWTLGEDAPDLILLAANATCAFLYFAVGLLFFRWREAKLVDVL